MYPANSQLTSGPSSYDIRSQMFFEQSGRPEETHVGYVIRADKETPTDLADTNHGIFGGAAIGDRVVVKQDRFGNQMTIKVRMRNRPPMIPVFC